LIYVTGGAALGLRLMWAGLPTLPVGQLPRDFLFSLGAAQIVAPALALGLVAGVIELGQDLERLKEGHRPWWHAKKCARMRRAYIAFYGTIPFVLISPGSAIAIHSDDRIHHKLAVLASLGGVALVLLLAWIVFQHEDWAFRRLKLPKATAEDGLGVPAWLAIVGPGLCLSLGLGLWMSCSTDNPRYLGIVGAWLVALFFALLAVWLRGRVGEQTRKHLAAVKAKRRPRLLESRDDSRDDPPADVPPRLVVISWCATALLAVPALIAVTAAWPLTGATVCAEREASKPYIAAGKFVGETNDRVYIGDAKNRKLISVPTGKISRLLVGPNAADGTACEHSRDVAATE
jgi:hypothetical protein